MLSNLRAVELSTICPNPNNCTIATPQDEVTNHGTFTSSSLIEINAPITHFTNYGTITNGLRILSTDYALGTITNYGEMRGVWAYRTQNITINNLGVMKLALGSYFTTRTGVAHFVFENNGGHLTIENFMIPINESQNEFNSFTGYTDKINNKNSHLMVWGQGNNFVSFKDNDSKLILDFGNSFEFGKEYQIDKLITNQVGNSLSFLNVDFSRLTTRSELYTLTQRGNNFIVNPADSKTAGYSTIGLLHKSNVKTMNSFYLQSNNVIYPKRHTKRKRTLQRRVIRKKVSSLREIVPTRHSELSLESEESMNLNNGLDLNSLDSFVLDSSLTAFAQNDRFFYKSDSNYYANNATTNQRVNQTNQTRRRITTTNRASSNQSTQNNNYYFVLTPFVAHNYFFESGRYNLSGLEYGFITAFGGNISPSNYLGAHFAFSYGSLSDKNDKIFNITSSNMMVGLNYKFSMIWSMYLKARIDAFYFLNQVQSIAVTSGRVIKPNNLGFGASVAYGKEWDFGNGGILGAEVALDYKGLISPNVIAQNGGDANINESFSKAFYNMLYVDLGVNYDKYFESSVGKWGLDTGLGIKGNITANALAKSRVSAHNNARITNMTLDNDRFIAYLNIGGSYLLESKDYDMEFSLAYYGNYGDRTMSNGGGFEWRVVW